MEVLAFTVINKEIECDIKQVVGDNDYQASFMLDAEWNDKEVICRVVWNNRTSLDIALEDLSCVIPAYIMKRGEVSIGVYAEGDEQLTTEPWLLSVRKSIREKEFETAMPHKEIWNEINEKIKNVITNNDLDEKVVLSVNDAIEKSGLVKNDELSTEVSTQVNAYLPKSELAQDVNSLKQDLDTILVVSNKYEAVDVTWVNGYYYYSSRKEIIEHAKARYTIIDVTEGEKYIISGQTYYQGNLINVYDVNNELLYCFPNTIDTATVYTDIELTIPVNGAKLVINNGITTEYRIDKMVTTKGFKINTFSTLYGKSLYVDGDSIALGAGTQDTTSYAELLRDKYNMTMTKKAVGGTTVTIQDGKTNSILERVRANVGTYDYVVIEGGINDVFNDVAVGTITNDFVTTLDENTYCGAMEALCKELLISFMNCKKIFVLIHRKSMSSIYPEKQDRYFDLAVQILNKWSIPYIDLRKECNLSGWSDEWVNLYFSNDNGKDTHPNELAYEKFYLPLIEAKLQTL